MSRHSHLKLAALMLAVQVASPLLAHAGTAYEYRKGLKTLTVSADASTSTPAPSPAPTPAPAPGPAPSPAATLSTATLDFGDVDAGTAKELGVTLLSSGTGALSLTSAPALSGDPQFTFPASSTTCGASLAASASCDTTVLFAPTAAGAVSATLSFASNAAGSPSTVTLTGTGRAAVAALAPASTSSSDFGTVIEGNTVTRDFVFSVTGNKAASNVVASVTGAALSLTGGTCGTAGSPSTVAAGSSCTVTVSYSPTGVGSLSAASVSVVSSAYNGTQSVALSGTAIHALTEDPYLSSVSALLKFDAADGSTSFVDSRGLNSPVLSGAGPTQRAAAAKFGSGGFQGAAAGRLTMANNARFNFGNGDFTIEYWVKLPDTTNTHRYILNYGHQPSYAPWSFTQEGANIQLYMSKNTCGGWDLSNQTVNTSALTAGVWYHVAVSRTGSSVKTFLNGTNTRTFNVGTNSLCVPTGTVNIGGGNGGVLTDQFVGQVDDVRLTKGVGRYSANFTVTEAPNY